MKIVKLIIFIILIATPSYGAQKTYGNLQCINLVSVYDGDSFRCNVSGVHPIIGDSMAIRLYGVDTPEIRGKTNYEKKLARKAKAYTFNALSNAKIIELRNIRRGKYFRIVADVYYDNKSLSKGLIDAGLAYKYFGGTKKPW
jgi:micrococcal nuclease